MLSPPRSVVYFTVLKYILFTVQFRLCPGKKKKKTLNPFLRRKELYCFVLKSLTIQCSPPALPRRIMVQNSRFLPPTVRVSIDIIMHFLILKNNSSSWLSPLLRFLRCLEMNLACPYEKDSNYFFISLKEF